jgi:predicted transcriptional regulator
MGTDRESVVTEALISIRPEYVGMIKRREKSADIRSGTVSLEAGTRLWIYSTLPTGRLEAVARVQAVVSGSPYAIWTSYRDRMGISHDEFLKYANGYRSVSAILLREVAELKPAPSLKDIRAEIGSFNPPQRLRRMWEGDPLLRFIRHRLNHFQRLQQKESLARSQPNASTLSPNGVLKKTVG